MIQYSVTLLNRNTLETLLVGGLEHLYTFVIFRSIGNFIIPTDFHIFQRGRSTTSQTIVVGFTFLSFFRVAIYIYIYIHMFFFAGHPRLAMYMDTNLSEETL